MDDLVEFVQEALNKINGYTSGFAVPHRAKPEDIMSSVDIGCSVILLNPDMPVDLTIEPDWYTITGIGLEFNTATKTTEKIITVTRNNPTKKPIVTPVVRKLTVEEFTNMVTTLPQYFEKAAAVCRTQTYENIKLYINSELSTLEHNLDLAAVKQDLLSSATPANSAVGESTIEDNNVSW